MTNDREGAGLGIRTEDQVTDGSCIRWEEKREELMRRGNYIVARGRTIRREDWKILR